MLLNIIFWGCIIVAFVFGIVALFDEYNDLGLKIILLLISPVIGFMIGIFLMLIISCAVSLFAKQETVFDYQENLYTIQDNITTNGNFFLGTGRINDNLKFYYATKDDKGIQIKTLINDSNVRIIEDDEKVIKYYKPIYSSEIIKKLFTEPMISDYQIELHIPKSSVIMDYNIDLK